jgi:general secretion pathway protein M
MKWHLSPLQNRLLAVSILLLFCLVAAACIYLLNRDRHAHYDTAIANSLDHIARYERVIATRKDIEAGVVAVKTKDAKRFYLKSSGPALAASEVQQAVQEIINANGLKIESTQIVPHKDEDAFRRISVSLKVRGKLPDLQACLFNIESGMPWLFVHNLIIRSTIGRVFRPTPGIEPDITAQFDVLAFAQNSTQPPTRHGQTAK